MHPRNFLSNIYRNDDFLKVKTHFENDLIKQTKDEADRKHFISDVDSVLKDLDKWKKERSIKH